ncbi:MAG TPA: tetratricopeptide repeat protein [Gemmatimonadaceae bacterium]|nr:tetratricopeptide repeat protein [Gemmatimonadaceae bacterium]
MNKFFRCGSLAVLLSGCYASNADLLRVQSEVSELRASGISADSARRLQLNDISRSLRALTDSISALNSRIGALRSTSETEVSALRQDITQLQDLGGQSERRLREMRATIEETTRQPEMAAEPGRTTGTASPAPRPGPAQLLQVGREQLLRGSNAAARTAFADLMTRYPESEFAPEALFYTAQAFAAEGKPAAADSSYASLVTRFPSSRRIPTALYKRALHLGSAGKRTESRQLLQDLVRRFPRSDEAALAEERLQSTR